MPLTPDQDTLVLGLGNTLLGDDGVGIHVVQRLQRDPATPPGLRAVDGGTLGFRLMELFADASAVLLVDAVKLGGPAGTIHLLEADELNRHIRRGGRVSAHEAGLVDLLTLATLEGRMPQRIALLGIEAHRIEWDTTLSPPLEQALPAACVAAIDAVHRWRIPA